jgi:hypothetical protein
MGAARRIDDTTSDRAPALERRALLVEETMSPQMRSFASRSMALVLSVGLMVALTPAITAIAGRDSQRPVGTFEQVAIYDVPGQVAEIIMDV